MQSKASNRAVRVSLLDRRRWQQELSIRGGVWQYDQGPAAVEAERERVEGSIVAAGEVEDPSCGGGAEASTARNGERLDAVAGERVPDDDYLRGSRRFPADRWHLRHFLRRGVCEANRDAENSAGIVRLQARMGEESETGGDDHGPARGV